MAPHPWALSAAATVPMINGGRRAGRSKRMDASDGATDRENLLFEEQKGEEASMKTRMWTFHEGF